MIIFLFKIKMQFSVFANVLYIEIWSDRQSVNSIITWKNWDQIQKNCGTVFKTLEEPLCRNSVNWEYFQKCHKSDK